jgi:hypothetical protein
MLLTLKISFMCKSFSFFLSLTIYPAVAVIVVTYILFQSSHVLMSLFNLKVPYSCQTYWLPKSIVGSRDGVVSVATHYGLDGLHIKSRWGRDFLWASRPALRPTWPPVQWIPGLSQG